MLFSHSTVIYCVGLRNSHSAPRFWSVDPGRRSPGSVHELKIPQRGGHVFLHFLAATVHIYVHENVSKYIYNIYIYIYLSLSRSCPLEHTLLVASPSPKYESQDHRKAMSARNVLSGERRLALFWLEGHNSGLKHCKFPLVLME